jgi:predicted amidophosphoribosyltransferase
MRISKNISTFARAFIKNVASLLRLIERVLLPINIIGQNSNKYFDFRDKMRKIDALLTPRIVGGFKMYHLLDYDAEIKELVYKAKMNGEYYFFTSISKDFSRGLRKIVNNLGFGKKSVLLINSPADPYRYMIRGYDGAEIMIKNLKHIGWVCQDCLYKNKSTLNQSRLSREERMINNANNYSLAGIKELAQIILNEGIECIVFIDDVITTGTTASYCLQTLELELAKYAKKVDLISVSLAGL